MVDGKPGPPRILVRRHILDIKEDTRDWLEEQLDELKAAFVVGKTARAVGETAKGILSHPVGFAAVAGPITALLIALFVKPENGGIGIAGRDVEREWIGMILGALPIDEKTREQGVENLLGAIRTMRKLFGLEFPTPPPEEPPAPGGSGGGAG